MASLYTQIDKNKSETVLVIILFIAVITALGAFFGYFYGGDTWFFVGLALIFSGATSFISYYNSASIVLGVSKAQEIKVTDNDYLHKLVDNLCIASGLPKPKIYMIQDSAMNAFATGRDPDHAVICVTSGLVEKLEKRELEGVIAHELSHIGNFDIRLMSIVSVLVGTVILIVDGFSRGVFSGRRSKDSGGGVLMLLGLLFVVLSPVIATLIKLAISRKREYLADATAAMITRYPQGLASALRKLAADNELLEAANRGTAHMYIVNPIKGGALSGIGNLFETHPPIQDRIARLEGM